MLNYRKGLALLYATFEVLTALLLKIPVFWDITDDCINSRCYPTLCSKRVV
jgi:hypothetical protein